MPIAKIYKIWRNVVLWFWRRRNRKNIFHAPLQTSRSAPLTPSARTTTSFVSQQNIITNNAASEQKRILLFTAFWAIKGWSRMQPLFLWINVVGNE